MTDRVTIEGSEPNRPAGVRRTRAADPAELVQATIVLRRRPDTADTSPEQFQSLRREQREEALGAHPDELQQVEKFVTSYGLRILESSAVERRVRVSGTVAQMNAAFGTDLSYYQTPSGHSLGYQEPLTIPAALKQIVVAVLGLDQQPVARR